MKRNQVIPFVLCVLAAGCQASDIPGLKDTDIIPEEPLPALRSVEFDGVVEHPSAGDHDTELYTVRGVARYALSILRERSVMITLDTEIRLQPMSAEVIWESSGTSLHLILPGNDAVAEFTSRHSFRERQDGLVLCILWRLENASLDVQRLFLAVPAGDRPRNPDNPSIIQSSGR